MRIFWWKPEQNQRPSFQQSKYKAYFIEVFNSSKNEPELRCELCFTNNKLRYLKFKNNAATSSLRKHLNTCHDITIDNDTVIDNISSHLIQFCLHHSFPISFLNRNCWKDFLHQ